MLTTTVSTKGQVVIPTEARRHLGIRPGEVLSVEVDAAQGAVILARRESLAQMRARFSSWIAPDTPPLMDTSELYEIRDPRL